jgi:hypothetical protein
MTEKRVIQMELSQPEACLLGLGLNIATQVALDHDYKTPEYWQRLWDSVDAFRLIANRMCRTPQGDRFIAKVEAWGSAIDVGAVFDDLDER